VLAYRFNRVGRRLSILLQQEQSGAWITIRNAGSSRYFKGTRRTSVEQLFGGRSLDPGSYRLLLSSGKTRASLRFSIFAGTPLIGAQSVGAGGILTCILTGSGSVECWGANADGELGDGGTTSSPTPVPVSGVSGATQVSSGYHDACVVLASGTVRCWGNNSSGQLGNGTNTSSSLPIAVSGLTGVVASASGVAHSCAVLASGALECWGNNEVGQLGTGTVSPSVPFGAYLPVQVPGISGAVSVSAGFFHTCVLLQSGSIECWGYNFDGQVGDGSVTHVRPYAHPSPATVSGITNAVAISSGYFHTCALLADGRVSCWGYIATGELNGVLMNSPVPRLVPGIEHAIGISSGGFHTCALIEGGSVECWGQNQFGQLGDRKTVDSAKPVKVVGISNAVAIGSGAFHSCAIVAGEQVECWGRNSEGELGTGTITTSSIPITVVRP
jgi:alpha-tubulin suppressor-like RCC1 family protein